MTILQLKYAVAVDEAHSMREAATRLYVSQPGLSNSIKELENELGIQIFQRVPKGVVTTAKGADFLSYARIVLEQYEILEHKFLDHSENKQEFSVSMQHYSFAVNAFIETIKSFGMEEYQFSIHETQTQEVINDVKNFKSEVGVVAVNDFNRQMLKKLFLDYQLEFHELFLCKTYAYLWKDHPLAKEKELSLKQLEEYPCMVFDQGQNNSFYFREEALATYDYKKTILSNERATAMELLIGLNGYAVGSGLLNENLSNPDYVAVKLKEEEELTLGYLVKKGVNISPIGEKYIEELKKSLSNNEGE